MNIETELLKMNNTLGRMEGKLDLLTNIPERVSMLEQWQSWLNRGLGFLAAGLAYVFKAIYGK